jgi:hypothetical protein
MLRTCLVVAFYFLGSFSTHAQVSESAPLQGFAGYSYTRFDTSAATTSSASFNGVEISGQYRFTKWLGAVADLSGSVGTLGIPPSMLTYLFGPEVSFRARVSPFGHVLIGAAHFGAGNPGSDTSFATAIGGGIDLRVAHGLYWRAIQGDYLPTRFNGGTQNNARISTGLVVRLHIGS